MQTITYQIEYTEHGITKKIVGKKSQERKGQDTNQKAEDSQKGFHSEENTFLLEPELVCQFGDRFLKQAEKEVEDEDGRAQGKENNQTR